MHVEEEILSVADGVYRVVEEPEPDARKIVANSLDSELVDSYGGDCPTEVGADTEVIDRDAINAEPPLTVCARLEYRKKNFALGSRHDISP